MTRSAPPTSSSTHTMESQTGFGSSTDVQIQMIQKFSQQSGMTIEYSKLLVFSFLFKNIYIRYISIIVVWLKMIGIMIKLDKNFKNAINWFVFILLFYNLYFLCLQFRIWFHLKLSKEFNSIDIYILILYIYFFCIYQSVSSYFCWKYVNNVVRLFCLFFLLYYNESQLSCILFSFLN